MNFNMVTAFTESQASFRSTTDSVSPADTYRDMMKKIMKSDKMHDKDTAKQPETDDGQEAVDVPAAPDENAAGLIQANMELNALVWIQPPIAPAAGFVQPGDQAAGQAVQEAATAAQQEIAVGTPALCRESVPVEKSTEGSLPIDEQAFSVGKEAAVKENNSAVDMQAAVSGSKPEKQAEQQKADPAGKERTVISSPEKKENGQNSEAEALKLQPAPKGVENFQPVRQQQEVQEAAPLYADNGEENVLKLPKEIPIRLQAGEKEFSVQLEPEHLGKLMIKAAYQDGKAVVSIICTNEKTLELLSNRAGDLGGLMEKSLGMPTQVYLDKPEQNYLNLAQDGRNGRRDGQEEKEDKEGKHHEKSESPDFLQQLRLGLV